MLAVDPGNYFCESSREGAALGLLGLMTGLSEELFCAAWMQDLEYRLWEAQSNQPFGRGEVTERQAQLLRLLSAECDGWWVWGDDRPRFMALDRWRAEVSTRE